MFDRLFQPVMIGKVPLKNKIFMAPMATWMPSGDGSVTESLIDYYAERAAGGAAALVVEATYLTTGKPKRLCMANDSYVPGLKRLTGAIHEAGSKAFIQIHPGKGRYDETDPVSASEVLSRTYTSGPTGAKARPLKVEEIEKIVADFGAAALRAKRAGFDGIELHAGHGYLIGDFMSPAINKRTDKYGGSLEKRARFAVELIKAAKREAGEDYAFVFRLSVDEVGGSLSLDESVVLSKLLEKAGVDAIDVDSGGPESKEWVSAPYYVAPGYNVHYAHRIKKSVGIPVSVAGRINDPYVAEDILEKNKADFITIGRALIADPEFPNKAAAGRVNEIRKCIGCMQCYESVLVHDIPVRCSVNPDVGREREAIISPASRPKKVLIIGGGPGGLEAARVASLRGHKVTLWEKSGRLGGQLNLAAAPPGKQELSNLIKYLEERVRESGVTIKLGTEARPPSILRFKPDVVIVATGSTPILPDIPGLSADNVVTAHRVLADSVNAGQRVLVIGGGEVGCETADYLACQGRQVSLTCRSDAVALDAAMRVRPFLLAKLKRDGVQVFSKAIYQELTDEGLDIIDRDGKRVTLEADTIVCACGTEPDDRLYRDLQGKVPELYSIGDCVQPRLIMNAVEEGEAVGQKI
ncbi:MAG: FAD-dependent oxidoreductase [Chloroflexi bacterium]|nr:FAD-dependent oxidoreductase [Chloroflexota bacterium]